MAIIKIIPIRNYACPNLAQYCQMALPNHQQQPLPITPHHQQLWMRAFYLSSPPTLGTLQLFNDCQARM